MVRSADRERPEDTIRGTARRRICGTPPDRRIRGVGGRSRRGLPQPGARSSRFRRRSWTPRRTRPCSISTRWTPASAPPRAGSRPCRRARDGSARSRCSSREELAAARKTLALSREKLAQHLRNLYEQGGIDPLAVMLGAQSLNDAVSRLDGLSRVADLNRRVVAATSAAGARLLRVRATLVARRHALEPGALRGTAERPPARVRPLGARLLRPGPADGAAAEDTPDRHAAGDRRPRRAEVAADPGGGRGERRPAACAGRGDPAGTTPSAGTTPPPGRRRRPQPPRADARCASPRPATPSPATPPRGCRSAGASSPSTRR